MSIFRICFILYLLRYFLKRFLMNYVLPVMTYDLRLKLTFLRITFGSGVIGEQTCNNVLATARLWLSADTCSLPPK